MNNEKSDSALGRVTSRLAPSNELRTQGSYRYNKYVRIRVSQNPKQSGRFLSVHVRIPTPRAVQIALLLDGGLYSDASKAIKEIVPDLIKEKKVGADEIERLTNLADELPQWPANRRDDEHGNWIFEAGYDFGGTVNSVATPEGQVLDLWYYIPHDSVLLDAISGAAGGPPMDQTTDRLNEIIQRPSA